MIRVPRVDDVHVQMRRTAESVPLRRVFLPPWGGDFLLPIEDNADVRDHEALHIVARIRAKPERASLFGLDGSISRPPRFA